MKAKTIITWLLGVGALLSVTIHPALADTSYEALPTTSALTINQSYHNAIGPIIADDFNPAGSGSISTIEWWGSAAGSVSWEVTFHNNDPLGKPAILEPFHGGLSHFVNAAGVADSGLPTGVLHYTASWTPQDWFVNAGTEYWFSVANANPGWDWAENSTGPTIGTEIYNAHNSTGGTASDGGPHAGPWNDVDTDFAFRLGVTPVPEPTTMILLGSGLIGLAGYGRKKLFKK